MNKRCLSFFLVVACCAACSSPSLSNLHPIDASPDVARSTPCTAGMVAACPCLGGGQGVQTCNTMTGVFGSCVCPGVDAGGTDVVTNDAGMDAPPPIDVVTGPDVPTVACTPGATSCANGTTVNTCNAAGNGYNATSCPAMNSCSAGICTPWTCTPNAMTCASSSEVSVCSANGLTSTTIACMAMDSCSAGACTGWICTPGAESCASSTMVQTCNMDGLAYATSACPVPANAASASCASNACGFTCTAGYGNCDGMAANGCEATLATDANNCGSCGHACAAPANASAACVSSTCGFACNTGYADCDHSASNGCESNSATDASNCGSCGHACAAGYACAAGACVSPPSCAVAGTPGCGFVAIPGGTFTMGGDPVPFDALPAQPSITVGAFTLDAYEVTVARFRRFWAAGHPGPSDPVAYPGGSAPWGGPTPVGEPSVGATGCSWTEGPATPSLEAHPITCINWWTAQAFCVWDGGRLPTEAEWEFAARGWAVDGLLAGRTYPWGTPDPTSSCDRAQFNDCAGDDGIPSRRVGSFAATAGLYDMAGNVWEWIADWYAPFTDATCWNGVSRTNPVCGNSTSAERELRGGSFLDTTPPALRGAERLPFAASMAHDNIGFRCARSP